MIWVAISLIALLFAVVVVAGVIAACWLADFAERKLDEDL